ncbi:hypothetical protein [Stackebrandtia nassauensis]|uniref:DUF1453 domain-containing protein n=1 Tax=Stackebrandtia nassauensis (strain DSM 44728 / CIP 108903 / NRRL B-16338 / NBRC 102104 / LLR-40K-21) TaxID=446470 RepID=D3Q8I3_STANL|nr:hypothetical protein [Stackebrandtia nassauensis]ADD42557.1 hypothetical protein Snas_2882 [Stackebrandtia nassauensis DSM 44728]
MDVLDKHPWLIVVAVLALVAYLIVRRLSGEPLNARDLCGPPLILTGIGVYEVLKADGLNPADYAWAAGGVVIGIGFGALRGSTVRLFVKNGVLWQRYTGRTFVVWIVSLVASGGFALLAKFAGMHPEARPTTLAIGIGLLGEMAVVGLRALASGQRFSPESRDRHAVVHDHMRQTLRGEAKREDIAPMTLRDSFNTVTGRTRDER